MKIKKLKLGGVDFPDALQQMAKPPSQIYVAGESLNELMRLPRVAIVGSRSMSAYGRQVTHRLAKELAEQGIVVISGLALGVDALAHKAVLEVDGKAIVVLPSPIQNIVPSTNRYLAKSILQKGGALISEYAEDSEPFKQNFVARNRIVAGLADAVLITEAAEKSGSLHTANFALQQGKLVFAVPGNITNIGSVGTNNLIKSGAIPVTSYQDILNYLSLSDHKLKAREVKGRNNNEQLIIDLLMQGIKDGEELLINSSLTSAEYNQVITMLEIGGKIRPLGANKWSIY